jgi:hypothetical protein
MLALILALSISAAPVEVEVHYMPLGTPLTLQGGEQVRYFRFDEYKLLLQLDGDLWSINRSLVLYKDIDSKYQGILAQKDSIIEAYGNDRRVLDERLKRSDENWRNAEKKLVAASGGPVWPYIVAAGGAVVGIVGATLWASTLVRR